MASLSEALSAYSVVIITGGSSGIGKSFIEQLHSMHPELRFCNLSRRKPEIKSAGLNLCHLTIDLSASDQIEPTVGEILHWVEAEAPEGKVMLINNSGFGGYGYFPEPTVAHQGEMIDLNIRAMVALTGLLLPLLRRRGGAILNVASTAAFQPTAFMSVYGATKAFVLHWSLALNEELRGSGVGALAICPGPTATEFFRRAGLQQGSVADALSMSSEAVVWQSLIALAAGRALVVTGWKNRLAAALVTKLPKPLAARLAARVLARYRLKQVPR